mgnify:CR=1 FL=1
MAKKRSVLDRYTTSQKYIVSRGKALTFPAAPFKQEIGPNQVYGAVIDIPMSPTVLASLVCFINGSANIYFNLGGEYINSAARYRGVAQASFDFIRLATDCLDCCKKTIMFIFLPKTEFTQQKSFPTQLQRKTNPKEKYSICIKELCHSSELPR